MNEKQWTALRRIDMTGEITEQDKAFLPGLHFCDDWDQLPIYDDSPEKESCTCDK